MKILIGGGSGFIGSHLSRRFRNLGHEVSIISRSPGPDRITWNQIEKEGIPECDAIVQIPGASVLQKRWTKERKEFLLESREGTTSLLVRELLKGKSKSLPKVFVSGSAISYYPNSLTAEYTEDYSGPPAANFAGELCARWEQASAPLAQLPIRRTVIRLGIVLDKEGGAFPQLLSLFRMGLGGRQGSGKQWWPWIHRADAVELFSFAVTSDVEGILNGVAPESVTNATMAQTLGRSVHRPAVMHLPSFPFKLAFGESAVMLLEGQKVIPKRTREMGFDFEFPTLESALKDIVAK